MHWLTLLLLVAVYALMELRGYFPRASATREAMKTAHFTLGLLVFALVWVRLALRLSGPNPQVLPTPATWMRWSATIIHVALYALLIAMPVIGWLALSAAGKPVAFFGVELPALAAPDKALASELEELHETIAVIGYYLIALHAAAALAHHYFWRDNTLARMVFPFSVKTEIRQGRAIFRRISIENAFAACTGLQTSKTLQSSANSMPLLRKVIPRSWMCSTPKPRRATAAARSVEANSNDLGVSTM